MTSQNRKDSLKHIVSRSWIWVSLFVFIIAAIMIGVVAFKAVYNVVASGSILPSDSPEIVDKPTAAPGEPVTTPVTPTVVAPSEPEAKVWDGASRVTILVMGLDARDWKKKEGPPRTDSMILLTIDPLTLTAGVLSIPRDLWVNIPGYGYYKINMAYYFGEGDKLPGGGPGLAMKTVEQFLGVPIDYYAQIDFDAFVKFINELDGITIDVPQKISVDPIGKYNTVILEPGVNVMDGEVALAYARTRETGGANDRGDFDRADRQWQVIQAVRRRLLKLWPTLLPKAPALYNELSSGIHTNLTLDQAIQLGLLALKVDLKNAKQAVISPPDQVILAKSPDGSQDILKPVTGKIRELRDQIFTPPASPLENNQDVHSLLSGEQARVSVLNGSGVAGLGDKTAEFLKSQGVVVTQTGNTAELWNTTRVTYYAGKPYTLRYLVDTMKIQPTQIVYEDDPGSDVDIVIILGADWAANNPMP